MKAQSLDLKHHKMNTMHKNAKSNFLPARSIVLLGMTMAPRSREFKGYECQTQEPLAYSADHVLAIMSLSSTPPPSGRQQRAYSQVYCRGLGSGLQPVMVFGP